MNILIIDQYAGSPSLGMEFRPYYLARHWQRMGHIVTVITGGYSHLRRVNPAAPKNFAPRRIDGVDFLIVKTPPYNGNGFDRAVNVLAFLTAVTLNSTKLAKTRRPDLVIASSTYPMDIFPASLIAKKSGGRLVWEIHDIYPDSLSLNSFGRLQEKLIGGIMERAVAYACKKADGIVSILSHAAEFFKTRPYGEAAIPKLRYIPNGIEEEEQREPSEYCKALIEEVKELKRQKRFTVMYLGGFAAANALDEFVWAAEMTETAAFLLVGNGWDRARLKKLAEKEKLCGAGAERQKVYFFDGVDKWDVPHLLAAADCLYIGAKEEPIYRYGVGMNKLYDYMLAARPIICGINAPFNVVKESGCGVVIPPQNSAEIAKAVGLLSKLPEHFLAQMGRKGREYVLKNNTYQILAQKFLAGMEQ